MPFLLIILGAVFLIAGVRGSNAELGALIKSQFAGFAPWAFALFLAAGIGAIEQLRPLSRAFMGLILLVMFLQFSRNSNTDLITQFRQQITGGKVLPVEATKDI